ncbi:uncharacterized protein LOC131240128 isoform X2 [Magnolia sinica]|uniref:uncharacterized protein LOC131240128 isoform X2 n=1 Tax=Magnolia sinica TaxID=86752 RepID=UPI002658DE72|nr:uncharacterized protein LOC131240128 isoform X2 [Magnolia sinica]
MESEEIVEEEVLRVLDSCISRIKWRLRSSSKRRLQTDILALCTGMRPVVMVDYGGKMPELQEQLCLLLHLCHKESSILWPLRIMIIQDMVYLIHVSGLAEHVQSGLSLQQQMLFVDLEQDPPKMVMQSEQNLVASQLGSIQNFFSSVFSVDETNKDISPKVPPPMTGLKMESAEHSGADELVASQSSELIDLSSCMQDTEVTLPTLNGWLLGYPVVYLSGKEHMADAIYNLSTKSLHLFKILVGRNGTSGKGPCQEELMSFTVPYDLSMGGEKEPWAKAFLAHMWTKFERCKKSWRYLRMEVSECYPQSIVL